MQDLLYKTLRLVKISLLIRTVTKSLRFFLGELFYKSNKETYKEVVKCVADKVHRVSISEPAAFDVKSMSSEGLAKVRHVGAWAIRRVVGDHQKYVQSNLVTKNRSTHDSVFRRMQVASLLEEHLVGNYESLKDRTKNPETLCVTEDRQFRSRGLTH